MAPEEALSAALFLHLGTSLASVLVLRKLVASSLKGIVGTGDRNLATFLVFGTAATLLSGIPLYLFLRQAVIPLYGQLMTLSIGIFLIFLAIFIKQAEKGGTKIKRAPKRLDSFIVGLLQGVAILPGVSRSGITTATLMTLGFGGAESLTLSFLLGIPVTIAASLGNVRFADPTLLPSMLVSFVTGFLCLKTLLAYSKKVKMSAVAFSFGLVSLALNLPLLLA